MRLIEVAAALPDREWPTAETIFLLCEVGGVAAAEGWLALPEAEVYAVLRRDKRRHDWLLGRWVAKRLIIRVLAASGHSLAPVDIVILPHADGWPQVALPSLGSAAPPLTLTISHAGDRAFCALAYGADRPLGADIEAVEPRSPGFVADYFTAAERDLMAAAPVEEHPILANTIWSGKEAALKAIRRGLAEDTRLVSCLPSPSDMEDGWRELIYRWEVSDRDLPALIGRWREAEGYVMTVAATRSQTNFDIGRGAPALFV